MNILVVGNLIKDVYLNLDSRTEKFETDKNNVKWLDLSFNASEHHFFSRESSLGGAAVTLEVLEKLGLKASISDSNLSFKSQSAKDCAAETYRYILISDGQVAYLTPTNYRRTKFSPPAGSVDYLFIDRSAEIDINTAKQINTYLDLSQSTKLILHIRNFNNPNLNQLISRAELIFLEDNQDNQKRIPDLELDDRKPKNIIYLSEEKLSYLDITESITPKRIDILTHLSYYSTAAATILGSFILGDSVENSLKIAKANLENSKLNAALSLNELKTIAEQPETKEGEDLELIAANLVFKPKGILAADESGGSIKKKFAKLNIPDTYENRRDYRNIFFTTKDLEKYVNGIILFDETARQFADNGQNFVSFLISRNIIPGIKVDQGLAPLSEINPTIKTDETYTKGLDGLDSRLQEYFNMGLRFAKWRAAFEINLSENGDILTPTNFAIEENCRILAEYAKKCQSAGIVPIVEPEVVYDGNYPIEKSVKVTSKILKCLFGKLEEAEVNLRATILKVNMILAGKQFTAGSTPEEVGAKTAKVLKECVPESLAGIVFLSGGQSVEQATENLAAIEKRGPFPWPVTFSFARALQDPALYTWQGNNKNTEAAREAFLNRLIKNSEALEL